MYAAVSIGLTAAEILRVLDLLSKCGVPETLAQHIRTTVDTVGKLKLILRNNRFFIESTDLALLQSIANDEEISRHRESRKPEDRYDDDTGFIIPDENEHTSAMIAGIGDSAVYGATSRIFDELGVDVSGSLPSGPVIVRRFEVKASRIRKVRERALKRKLPFTDEYDFRADTINPDLNLALHQATDIRPYQEKALSKMFGGGRAKSGIIVLPCGAGKTLVGISAACTIRKSVIVFCNGSVPVQQWADQFCQWTTIDRSKIIRLGSRHKQPLPDCACVLITTYTMVTHTGHRSPETRAILDQIEGREWGLMIMDEVQEMPATHFSKVSELVRAHSKLGLTATLVREDEKIADLGYLIGPKLYEANWMDLAEQDYIARVQCFEVWCKMTAEFFREYLRCKQLGIRRIMEGMNPNKHMTVQRLIRYHERRGDKILVFADIVWVLEAYAKELDRPYLSGKASDEERNKLFSMFKSTSALNCIFISRIGDKAIDLPSANVLIQILSHFGSRMQEAQRLGRILRAKAGRTDEYNAFFYTLVSEDTKEMFYSGKRQQFLVDQGYSFEVIQNPEERWEVRQPLIYSTVESQVELLKRCKEADDTAGAVETIADEDRDDSHTRENPRSGGRAVADLTGGRGPVRFANL
jgi:DNA excision repair protein ERCC-3